MNICDTCREVLGNVDCKFCSYGNPCLGCTDYDVNTDICISNGGCGVCNPADYRGVE